MSTECPMIECPPRRGNSTLLQVQLMARLRQQSVEKCISTRKGQIRYQEFYPGFTKPILDEIDRVLAKHYGFTDEELDFIINYDIKYRLGRGADGEDGAG